jgi:predicted RNase H-like nuclease
MRHSKQMYFVGVDLAWGERSPTGVAALNADGVFARLGAVRDDADITAALRPYLHGDCLVAIDAPLVVTNPAGQRPAEAALNRDFRRFEAGAHPANTGKPDFATGYIVTPTLPADLAPVTPETTAGRSARARR